jgi:hypothetical protein
MPTSHLHPCPFLDRRSLLTRIVLPISLSTWSVLLRPARFVANGLPGLVTCHVFWHGLGAHIGAFIPCFRFDVLSHDTPLWLALVLVPNITSKSHSYSRYRRRRYKASARKPTNRGTNPVAIVAGNRTNRKSWKLPLAIGAT